MRRQNISNEVILRLYNEGKLTSSYLALMALAGILTSVAVLTNSVPVLIGAMVIAPALPPVALAILASLAASPEWPFGVWEPRHWAS